MNRPALIALLAALPALASSPTAWEMNDYRDFIAGRLTGLSLTRDGKLTLAPKLETVFDSGQPIVWSVASAPDGRQVSAPTIEFRLPDGSLDRSALGRLVFSDPAQLAALESIVHPAIDALLERVVREAGRKGPRAIALEAVKLVEAGHVANCDEVWLITCDPAAQLVRLVGRGMSKVDALQRIEAQAPSLPLWQAAATRTIGTDGSRQEVESAVARALDEALARHR